MQTIQIDGTYTFANNIKNLSVGDKVILKEDIYNKINKNAVAVYNIKNHKIGYIPFTSKQIDIKANYSIYKIQLTEKNPVLLISRDYDESNIISISNNTNNVNKNYKDDLKHFAKILIKSGLELQSLEIIYSDDNFIDLLIETINEKIILKTVTKKYFNDNIFKYDEFYKLKLCDKCIFQDFQIYRLEEYIKKKYHLIKKGIFNDFDNIKETIINITSNNNYLINFQKNGLCYNHNLKKYCFIDYYDNDNIIDIIQDDDITDEQIKLLMTKLILSKKIYANYYNPIKGLIYKYELNNI